MTVNSKQCTRCDTVKPLTQFNVKSAAKDGRHSECRDCYRTRFIVDGDTNIPHPYNLTKYGLTVDDYSKLFTAQLGCCAICHRHVDSLPQRVLHVDHDHVTGKVRGLLCNPCNLALGWYEAITEDCGGSEPIKLIDATHQYLEGLHD